MVLFDPFGLLGLALPRISAGRDLDLDVDLSKTTIGRGASGGVNIRSGFLGGDIEFIDETIIEGDIFEGDTIVNIIESTFGGGFGQEITRTTKKEISQSATQTQEKPIQFSPSLIGGGTQATGQASASSGLNLTAIALIVVGGFVGFKFLTKGRKKGAKK